MSCAGSTGGRSSSGGYTNGEKSSLPAGDQAVRTDRLDDEPLTGGSVDGGGIGVSAGAVVDG